MRAVVGTAVIIVAPGFLVAAILGLRMRELLTWAAIPVFSLATVFLLGEATTLLRVPFGLPAFAALLVALGCMLVFVRRRRSAVMPKPEIQRHDDETRTPIEAWRGDLLAHILLGLGVAVGVLTWFRGLRNVPLIPPGGDATRHGWFVARILYEHTVELSQVLVYDVGGTHQTVEYYPLALHASAALSARLVGADIGRVLVAYIVVFSAVVLPMGMFVLARALAPSRPLVAGFTAAVVPLMMLFPYSPVWAGELPLIVAMAIVPVAIVLLRQAMLARQPRVRLSPTFVVAVAPAALAILCIISVHTSELPVVVFLGVVLVVERSWLTRDLNLLKSALVRAGAVGLLALVLFAPTLVAFVHGVAERAPLDPYVAEKAESWESSLGAILQLHWGVETVRQGVLALLAVGGAALFLMWRRPAWVAGWIGFVLLTVIASASTNRLAHELTFPWYHHPNRVVLNLAFFVPFFAGVTLAYCVVLITRISRRSWVAIPATLVLVAALMQFSGLHAVRANSAYVRKVFNPNAQSMVNQALVARSSLAAFRWLRVHAAPGDTVASEPFFGGALWMYTQQRVAPLVGPYTASANVPRVLKDHLRLLHQLPSLGRDARIDELARRYQTRWVFFDTHYLPLGPRFIELDALRRNPNLTAVFHQGGAWVFRIERT